MGFVQGSVESLWKGGHVSKAPWRYGIEPGGGRKEMWSSQETRF